MPRAYPEEFRQRAVELARQRAKPVSQIAADLGIAQSVLHRWVRQADIDAGPAKLNSRPRKTLDYDTPAHRMQALLP